MIQVKNLTKYFGPVMAVNNVSFQVEKDEIVGLLGNNGAGKTTIMRILTTYLPATSGIAAIGRLRRDDRSRWRSASGSATCPRAFRSTARCASRNTWTTAPSSRASIARIRPERIDYCMERCRVARGRSASARHAVQGLSPARRPGRRHDPRSATAHPRRADRRPRSGPEGRDAEHAPRAGPDAHHHAVLAHAHRGGDAWCSG